MANRSASSDWHASCRPFSDREIELVATFADQAVIAIENVRLFEAEQQRTRELPSRWQQQTATAKMLQRHQSVRRSIYRPVLKAHADGIRSTALRSRTPRAIWRAARRRAWRLPAPVRRLAREFEEFAKNNPIIPPRGVTGRAFLDGKPFTVRRHPGGTGIYRTSAYSFDLANTAACLGVPLLRRTARRSAVRSWPSRRGKAIYRQTNRAAAPPFADQAVIAIENVRLFEAEQQRRSRWNSRRRHRRCCRSSQFSRANCSRFSMPCWIMRRGFARPISAYCSARRRPVSRRRRMHNAPPGFAEHAASGTNIPPRVRRSSGRARGRDAEFHPHF